MSSPVTDGRTRPYTETVRGCTAPAWFANQPQARPAAKEPPGSCADMTSPTPPTARWKVSTYWTRTTRSTERVLQSAAFIFCAVDLRRPNITKHTSAIFWIYTLYGPWLRPREVLLFKFNTDWRQSLEILDVLGLHRVFFFFVHLCLISPPTDTCVLGRVLFCPFAAFTLVCVLSLHWPISTIVSGKTCTSISHIYSRFPNKIQLSYFFFNGDTRQYIYANLPYSYSKEKEYRHRGSICWDIFSPGRLWQWFPNCGLWGTIRRSANKLPVWY